MGAANFRRYCLQRLNAVAALGKICLAAWALLAITQSAQAQIFPTQGTLTYSASSQAVSSLKIEAVDGAAYELKLQTDKDTKENSIAVNLILTRAGQRENLLEPRKNWRGAQPFMFIARDLMNGPAASAFGAKREFVRRAEGLRVSATVAKAVVSKAEAAAPVLSELALDIVVSNPD